MNLANEWLKENKNSPSEDFIRYLMTYLCSLTGDDLNQITDIGQAGKPSLNPKQADELTENDLQLFAREFLINTDNLKSLSVEFGKDNEETDCDYLRRLIIAKEVTSKFKKAIFSSETRDLLTKNTLLSSTLTESYKDFNRRPYLPTINTSNTPAFKTNQHLERVAELITNMNALGISMAKDSLIDTANTKFWNRVMLGLGIATLAFSALVSYLSYTSSETSNISSESSALEQIHLLTEQIKNQDRIISKLSALNLKLVNPEKSSKLGLTKKDDIDNNTGLEQD
jgi:hypothetical protein